MNIYVCAFVYVSQFLVGIIKTKRTYTTESRVRNTIYKICTCKNTHTQENTLVTGLRKYAVILTLNYKMFSLLIAIDYIPPIDTFRFHL